MTMYKAPLRDIRFVTEELLDYPSHYQQFDQGKEATPDIINAILEEGARFCEEVLAPLNRAGDEEGCRLEGHDVKTPEGFRNAYQQYIDNGWPAMSQPAEMGGQGLPESLGIMVNEMMAEANWAWNMYPGLSHGAMETLTRHGTEQQKKTYLQPLISGQWTGTMCLTESHCGSDLGLLKTKAIPKEDGSYRLEGSKIFISSGEHDLSDNIIHIVLARLPDAPAGTKGISLFLVPKFLVDQQGQTEERNKVYCGSLEKKMGIHGNATCVLNFEGATGFLIGPANKGLSCMFTFMNFARLGTGLQGLAHSEIAWQNAWRYTRERKQGRLLSELDQPDAKTRLLTEHADVRRMLLTIKVFTEGNRALYYYICKQADLFLYASDEAVRQHAEQLMEFLTPICKAFMTETALESATLGIQCFGGHGYIREYGMEQNLRDARIATIYEGTTYIQSLDLLGRKVLLTQGELLRKFTKIIHKFCKQHENNESIKTYIDKLSALNKLWGDLSLAIGMKALEDREETGAAAYDYMMLSGYICLAWVWADMARVASEKLAENSADATFYTQKKEAAQFYYARILPRIEMHKQAIESGIASLSLSVD